MISLVSWLLIGWMCNGPGDCQWEIVGRYPTSAECEAKNGTLKRYAVCIEMTVPAPGSPGR